MSKRIISVEKHSAAERGGIKAGWGLLTINGSPVYDIIDYEQLTADEELQVGLENAAGEKITKHINKALYEPLGLNFESTLMSPVKRCANNCVFCFIDQMPRGNRETLYFKDDDWRLSLIMGNYITLTNVSDTEFERILARRVSPLYISVHAADGAVRKSMMRSKNAENLMPRLKKLHEAKLNFHTQIVLCPGINDGEVLKNTLEELYALSPECLSVAVVPVGLTRHRAGLAQLAPVTKGDAKQVISDIENFKFSHNLKGFAYASDEMYLRAELPLPPYEDYGDFEQLENGVGLYRNFEYGFSDALADFHKIDEPLEIDSVSGVSIAPLMQKLFEKLAPFNIKMKVHAVVNRFFGESVTVTGLTTAQDIISQCREKLHGKCLILPHTMMRENDSVFLDGMDMNELSDALGIPVFKVSADDGYDFMDDIAEITEKIRAL